MSHHHHHQPPAYAPHNGSRLSQPATPPYATSQGIFVPSSAHLPPPPFVGGHRYPQQQQQQQQQQHVRQHYQHVTQPYQQPAQQQLQHHYQMQHQSHTPNAPLPPQPVPSVLPPPPAPPKTQTQPAAAAPSTASGSVTHTIIIDVETTKLRVPNFFTRPTEALHRVTPTPTICRLYQRGSCHQGARCRQAHVDPKYVSFARQQLLTTPPCCLSHTDYNSSPAYSDNTPLLPPGVEVLVQLLLDEREEEILLTKSSTFLPHRHQGGALENSSNTDHENSHNSQQQDQASTSDIPKEDESSANTAELLLKTENSKGGDHRAVSSAPADTEKAGRGGGGRRGGAAFNSSGGTGCALGEPLAITHVLPTAGFRSLIAGWVDIIPRTFATSATPTVVTNINNSSSTQSSPYSLQLPRSSDYSQPGGSTSSLFAAPHSQSSPPPPPLPPPHHLPQAGKPSVVMIPLEQLCAAHHGAELLMLRSGGEQQQQGQQLSKEDSQGGESEGATTTSTRRKSTSTTTSILFEESSVTTPTTLVDDKSSSSNLVDTPSQPTSQPKHAGSSTVNNNNAAHQASSSSLSSSQRRKSSSTSSTTSPLLPSQSTKILCPFGPDCRFVHVCREELRARLLRLPHNKEEKPQPLDDIRKGQQNNAGGGSSGDNNETSAINNSVVIGSAVSARHSSAFDSEYEKVAEVDFTLMTPATPHNFAGKHFHSTSAAQAASPVTVATPQRHGGQSANTRTASVPAAGISLRVVIDDTPIVPMTSEGGPGVQSSGRDDSYHASTALPQYFQNHHQHHHHQDHCHNEGGGGAGPTPPFPYPHHNGLDSPGEFPPNFLNQHHYQFPMAAVSASVVGDLTSPDSAYLQPTHHQHQLRGSPTPQSHNPYLRGASSISPKGVGVTSQLQHQQSWMSQSFPSLSASDHHVRSSSLAAAGATNVTIVDDRHAVLSPGMLPPTPGRGGAQALMDESLTSPTGWASRSQQHQSRHVQQPASQPPAASLYRSDSDTASLFLSRTGGSGGSGGGDAMTPIGRAVGGCNQLSHPASSSSLFVRGDGSRVGAIMMATPSPRAASASSLSSTPVFGSGEDFVSGAGGAPSTAAAAAAPSSFGEDNTQKSSLLPFSGSHSYRPGSAISVTTTTDSPVTVVLSTKPSKHAASQLWLKRMNSAVASITTSPQTGKDIDMDSHAGSTLLRGGSGGSGGGFTQRRSPREPPALLFASASVEELSLSTVPLQHHHYHHHARGHQQHVQHQQHDAQSGSVQSGHPSYQRRASSHQSAGASRRASSATSSVASINLDADDASGAVARRFNEVTAANQHTTRNPQSTSSATTTFLLDGDDLQ